MIHFCFKRRAERALQGDNSLEESRVERMKKIPVNTKFVEEKIVLNIKYVEGNVGDHINHQ